MDDQQDFWMAMTFFVLVVQLVALIIYDRKRRNGDSSEEQE